MTRTRYRYDHVAWCYEGIARVYSLGAIPRIKASQVRLMKPGQRALYVGVGAGEDALIAARSDVDVSCLDLSKAMLGRVRKRFEREGLRAQLIESDVLDHHPVEPYDIVVANFVLNVFSPQAMHDVMLHLESLLAKDGRLLIADFTPPGPSVASRILHVIYYKSINIVAWALRLCALHPIYDYEDELPALALRVVSRTSAPRESGSRKSMLPDFYEGIVIGRDCD